MSLRTRLKNLFSRGNSNRNPKHRSAWSAPGKGPQRLNKGSVLFQGSGNITRKTTSARNQTRFQAEAVRPTDISLTDLEQIYRQEPLLRRGITKTASKLVSEGHTLRTKNGDEHPDNEHYQEWARGIDLRTKLENLIISAHVYGDGFLELAWEDETGENKRDIAKQPRPQDAELLNVFVADPVNMELHETREGEIHLVEDPRGFSRNDELELHPDRYTHLKVSELPGYHHGLSTAEAAWHAAHSKVMGDQAGGEILFHCGVPFRHAKIEGADEDETDAFTKFLNQDEVIRGFASDETITIDQLNPETTDPDPWYEAWLLSIAAAVEMPINILRGTTSGSVSGSRKDRRDWHDDLASTQENLLTDLIKTLASGHLNEPRSDIVVEWHPFETNPDMQAEIRQKQARAVLDLVNAGVTVEAAAESVGLELGEDAFRELQARDGTIPPGGGV